MIRLIVKNTMNLKYPTWPEELLPTVGGFQVWLAYIKSHNTSRISLMLSRAKVSLI